MMAAPLSAALNAARGQGAAMPPAGLPRGVAASSLAGAGLRPRFGCRPARAH